MSFLKSQTCFLWCHKKHENLWNIVFFGPLFPMKFDPIRNGLSNLRLVNFSKKVCFWGGILPETSKFRILASFYRCFFPSKNFSQGDPTRDSKNGPILKIRYGKNMGIFGIFRVF